MTLIWHKNYFTICSYKTKTFNEISIQKKFKKYKNFLHFEKIDYLYKNRKSLFRYCSLFPMNICILYILPLS